MKPTIAKYNDINFQNCGIKELEALNVQIQIFRF